MVCMVFEKNRVGFMNLIIIIILYDLYPVTPGTGGPSTESGWVNEVNKLQNR